MCMLSLDEGTGPVFVEREELGYKFLDMASWHWIWPVVSPTYYPRLQYYNLPAGGSEEA